MAGAIILVVCMLLFVPLIFVIGGITMGVLGWAATAAVIVLAASLWNEASELIELNQ